MEFPSPEEEGTSGLSPGNLSANSQLDPMSLPQQEWREKGDILKLLEKVGQMSER